MYQGLLARDELQYNINEKCYLENVLQLYKGKSLPEGPNIHQIPSIVIATMYPEFSTQVPENLEVALVVFD
jgi:hypothetical protein